MIRLRQLWCWLWYGHTTVLAYRAWHRDQEGRPLDRDVDTLCARCDRVLGTRVETRAGEREWTL